MNIFSPLFTYVNKLMQLYSILIKYFPLKPTPISMILSGWKREKKTTSILYKQRDRQTTVSEGIYLIFLSGENGRQRNRNKTQQFLFDIYLRTDREKDRKKQ